MPPSDMHHKQSGHSPGLRPPHVSTDFLSIRMQDFPPYVSMFGSASSGHPFRTPSSACFPRASSPSGCRTSPLRQHVRLLGPHPPELRPPHVFHGLPLHQDAGLPPLRSHDRLHVVGMLQASFSGEEQELLTYVRMLPSTPRSSCCMFRHHLRLLSTGGCRTPAGFTTRYRLSTRSE